MRAVILASIINLAVPIHAHAEPTCAVPDAATAQPIEQAAAPAVAGPYQVIGSDRIARVPALRRLASQGAQLFDLGVDHALTSVFARNGNTFQVYFLAPDGQAAVGGIMWDAAGKNLTRPKVELIDGVIPTVTIGSPAFAPTPPPVQTAAAANPSLPRAPVDVLETVEKTAFGTAGLSTAPRVYMLVDPLCSYSVRAMDQLASNVTAGKVELALVPVSILDYEDRGQSTPAARVLLTVPANTMVEAWRKQTNKAPLKPDLASAGLLNLNSAPLPLPSVESAGLLERNMAALQELNLRGTPTFVWRKPDGGTGIQEGMPANIDAFVASLGR